MYAKFFQLFLIMMIGFVVRRLRLIDERVHSGLNNLIVYLFFPCLIIQSIATLDVNGERLLAFLVSILLALAVFGAVMLFVNIYLKVRKYKNGPTHETNVYPAAYANMITPNSGFLGFAIVLIFYGADGLFVFIAQNVVMMMLLLSVIRDHFRDPATVGKPTAAEKRKRLLKTVFQPHFVGAYIGLLLAVTGIGLPGMLSDLFTSLGGIAAPLAMLFTGSILAGSREPVPKSEIPVIAESCVVRLLVAPAIACLISVVAVRLLGVDPMTGIGAVISMACPAAVLVAVFADEQHCNERLASWIVVISTALSMFTIPLWIQICDRVF